MGKKLVISTSSSNEGSVAQGSKDGNSKGQPGNFEQALEHFHTAVIITDKDGHPLSCNQSAIEILGRIPSSLRLSDWVKRFELFQVDDKTSHPGKGWPLLRALRGENAEGIVYLDGFPSEESWISMSARPLLAPDGRVSGALVFLNEIMTGNQVVDTIEKHKKLAEASYNISRQIAEIGNDPRRILNKVVTFAAETIGDGCVAALLNISADRLKVVAIHHILPEAEEMLGQSGFSREYGLEGTVERVVRTGKPLLVPVIDQSSLLAAVQSDQVEYMERIGLSSLLVVPINGRNGVLGTLSLIRDRGGSAYTGEDQAFLLDVAYRVGLAIDNTSLLRSLRMESFGRQKAEKALETSEVRFQSIFTSTALAIKILDLDGNILETNPAFQKMLGYSEDELVGKPITAFLYPPDALLVLRIIDTLKNDDTQSFQMEHRLVNKDGSIVWVNVTFTGIKKTDSNQPFSYIVAIASNITQRKQMEAEMAEMKGRLQSHVEMERLQLAQELHDGPLQDLYSAIYKIDNWRAQEDPNKTEKLKQDLLKVIRDLRNTAKNLRPPALANFGLEKAIRSHAEDFSEDHPDMTIQLYLASDKQVLPEEIRLILFRIYQHSITNILRHAQASQVIVKFSFDAEEAYLEIQDNGVGFKVPDNWMDLVRQGHFGLAGAVERVSLLEGKFVANSQPGAGTTIQVVVPINEP